METSQVDKLTEKCEETRLKSDIEKYISQMDELEKKSYLIAKDHLESSFSIEKSVGFLKWKASQET
jgi:hypothetical protein